MPSHLAYRICLFRLSRLCPVKKRTLGLCSWTPVNVHYEQGQAPEPKIREYFYYIDHQGQLFLDDARMKNFTSCFKDKVFLAFFFKRLRINNTSRYKQDFPYVSLCGRERNFVRCDDVPIVYTEILRFDLPGKDGTVTSEFLSLNCSGSKMTVPFNPEKLCMLPRNGRVYYPAADVYGGVGLVTSGLAIELAKFFDFDNGVDQPPTNITWNGRICRLTNEILQKLN